MTDPEGYAVRLRDRPKLRLTFRVWDPLRDLLSLQERMNRLFEESLARERELPPGERRDAWSPAADVYETAESFVVLVELPGVSEDDVVVTVDGDELRLRGAAAPSPAPRPESFHRSSAATARSPATSGSRPRSIPTGSARSSATACCGSSFASSSAPRRGEAGE